MGRLNMRRRLVAVLVPLAMLAGLMVSAPLTAGAVAGNLTGTISIDLNASNGLLTANTGLLSGQSDSATNLQYKWSVAGEETPAVYGTDATFNAAAGAVLGKVITLSVQDVGTDAPNDIPSELATTAAITVYEVAVSATPDPLTGDDAVSVTGGPYFSNGSAVTIHYTLDDSGSATNTLTFGAPISETVSTAGESDKTFNAGAAGSVDGKYTVTAAFAHTNKTQLTITGVTVANKPYDGNAVTPVTDDLTLMNGDTEVTLPDGTDLTASDIVYTYKAGDTALPAAPANAGTYTLTVSIDAGNAKYSGTGAPIPFTISKAAGTLATSVDTDTATIGDPAYDFADKLSNGIGEITYESKATSVATVDENGQVTFIGAGVAIITAADEGDSNHAPSTPVTVTITVSKKASFTGAVAIDDDNGGTVKLGTKLTANISTLGDGVDATNVTYRWEMNGVTVGTGPTYTVNDAGFTVDLTVTAAANNATYSQDATSTKSTAAVPYKILVVNKSADATDVPVKITSPTPISDTEAEAVSGAVALAFEVKALAGADNNLVGISFVGATTAGSTPSVTYVPTDPKTHSYTVKREDSVNGVITITADFYHAGALAVISAPDGTKGNAYTGTGNVEIKINAPFASFVGLEDEEGTLLTPGTDYTAFEGSTVIRFSAAYSAAKLSAVGTYGFTAYFDMDGDGGAVESPLEFNVVRANAPPQQEQQTQATVTAVGEPAPQTGDGSNAALWIVMLALACAGGTVLVLMRKRIFAGKAE